jgi:hypothetical protein
LLGVRCLISGIRPELARASLSAGGGFSAIGTARTLSQAIRLASRGAATRS